MDCQVYYKVLIEGAFHMLLETGNGAGGNKYLSFC